MATAVEKICDGCGSGDCTLQCPVCKKAGYPSWFCSQDCFKASWKKHLHVHSLLMRSHKEGPKDYRFSGDLRPGKLSMPRRVPLTIPFPDYATTGVPKAEKEHNRSSNAVEVKSSSQIEKMRVACALAREVLDAASSRIEAGVTTDFLDEIAHAACVERGAYPSPLNYARFPKSLCASVNEVICHGIPDSRPLKNGDVVNLDVTIYHGGFHGDVNETFLVGDVDDDSVDLVKTTYEAFSAGIQVVAPGVPFKSIGKAISKVCKQSKQQCSVVRQYCGHGIGELFHTAPTVQHYAKNSMKGKMKAGHTFTIEPMVNRGPSSDCDIWPDDWTVTTLDGERSAQFEHTLLVVPGGVEILTARGAVAGAPPKWDRRMFQR